MSRDLILCWTTYKKHFGTILRGTWQEELDITSPGY